MTVTSEESSPAGQGQEWSPGEEPAAMIEVQGLSRHFGDLIAVDRMDLAIHRGEVFGFLGPNGAGKSTLIRMLVGLLTPTSGSAKILGFQIPEQAEDLRQYVGYMTQRFSLYEDLTVQENLEFTAEIFGLSSAQRCHRVKEVLEEYGLSERRKQFPATLSGGWKQRLALAAATVHKPRLIVLDEPTAGVDPENRRRFWEKLFDLAASGTTLLVSTHYMDEAVRCHRLCLMRQGRQTALGSPRDLIRRLRGRVVEILCEATEQAVEALSEHPLVDSATQLGHRIHILLREGGPASDCAAETLRQHLQQKGLGKTKAEAVEANLEDVFVAMTRQATAAATATTTAAGDSDSSPRPYAP